MATKTTSSSSSPKPALTVEEQQKIVSGFQVLRDEQIQLIQKNQDLEMDLKEHDLVLSTLSTITDKQRRCYRMIGGILLEHTIGEVVPALKENREQIHNIIENFKQTKDLAVYQQKYDIHFSHKQSEQQQVTSKKQSQESGVLIDKEN
jgi:prefoldin subunit 2